VVEGLWARSYTSNILPRNQSHQGWRPTFFAQKTYLTGAGAVLTSPEPAKIKEGCCQNLIRGFQKVDNISQPWKSRSEH